MKQTQIGWVVILIIAIIDISAFFQMPYSSGKNIFFGITTLVLLLSYNLTIRVTDEYVKFSFGIGLIRGKYKLSDIATCRPDSYFALGWGIRFRPEGILYNVSGNKAIELTFKHKAGKVWLGTNVPEELAEYINSKIRKDKL
ncbi:MAG: hypothetical protein A2W90_12595 [Bacteroidetes bacterium GWF2_42_66]|nr:MAG: hypothetical protein A2W92_22830 [Bacteroidetes bacterium GWA2_42_15]OFY00065.1 MAG: hypothetical protein A2W89_17580 [Bacteroidetes bacterium GWE2_42_39]OFY40208.1 MAG: hypothetical protein A2W90_12595 [Bacteroidetes bacterium GWF2_42_66]HBL74040.1 hypothetical protein [Prolixibacteraceae bacterium]HCR89542.1 hypothetical protein [Prolixibacteraceae bacterium]